MSFDFLKNGFSNEGVGKFYKKRAGINTKEQVTDEKRDNSKSETKSNTTK